MWYSYFQRSSTAIAACCGCRSIQESRTEELRALVGPAFLCFCMFYVLFSGGCRWAGVIVYRPLVCQLLMR